MKRSACEVYVKVMKVRSETVVAICDHELLGRKFNDKRRGLNFEVKESFFKGSKLKIDESICFLKDASIANLIGARIVEMAVKEGFVHPSSIIRIAGIPHAQILNMRLA